MARRAAEEARAQLGAEVERARSAVRAEADQAALMQKLEQLNLLRESNATLRWVPACWEGLGAKVNCGRRCGAGAGGGPAALACSSSAGALVRRLLQSLPRPATPPPPAWPRSADNERAQRSVRELQQRVRSAESQVAPLHQRIRALEAAAEGAAAELAGARDQADRWQKRAQQLMQKYESVDQQEHQRVLAELKAAQDKAAAAEAAVATAAAEATSAQQALARERDALTGVRRKLEEAEKENAGRAQELAKAKVGSHSVGVW